MPEELINSMKSDLRSQIMSQTKLPEANIDKVFSIIGEVAKKRGSRTKVVF
jgi:hypothetical protein